MFSTAMLAERVQNTSHFCAVRHFLEIIYYASLLATLPGVECTCTWLGTFSFSADSCFKMFEKDNMGFVIYHNRVRDERDFVLHLTICKYLLPSTSSCLMRLAIDRCERNNLDVVSKSDRPRKHVRESEDQLNLSFSLDFEKYRDNVSLLYYGLALCCLIGDDATLQQYSK